MSDEHSTPGREGAPNPRTQPVRSSAGPTGVAPIASHPGPGPAAAAAGRSWPAPGSAWPAGGPYGSPAASGWYPAGPAGGHPAAVADRPRGRRALTGIVTAALLAGLVGGGIGFGGAYAVLGDPATTPQLVSAPATRAASTAVPGSVAAAAATATPSTVDIEVSTAQGRAEGSGVVLTADGRVLTNNHVVAGAGGDITVTLSDGSEQAATVVGTSPSYDLAVLALRDVSGLTPAALGRSSDVEVGQQVVAIGSPRGLSGTVTTGIVSAFDRTVQVQGDDGTGVVYNGLQTDASINPGNSGGPLVNLDGQVVGINSAIATGGGQSSGSIGLGFAIPVDQARRVAQEIMDTGTATKPSLGVEGRTAASAGDATGGAQIASVQAGSPAEQAGLAAGDVVTRVGAAGVEDFSDLVARVGSYAPGAQVELTIAGGRTVTVTLGRRPDRAATTDTGGESTDPFGGRSPFDNGG